VKILISAHWFSPSVGGIETVTEILAAEFVSAGHEVVVITQTGESDARERPFTVVRKPGFLRLLEIVKWCDVFVQNSISLRVAWPLLVFRRPWIVIHATWTPMDSAAGRVKHFLFRFATNVSITEEVRKSVKDAVIIIENPYDERKFFLNEGGERLLDLVFLGRLVSDKGVDLALQALHHLNQAGNAYTLTIIGSGPDEDFLRKLTFDLRLEDKVKFLGSKSSAELNPILNQHKILVVPSRWNEPFGIVALEGIACGCLVVGSSGGGLPGAIGPCGLTFIKNDVADLVRCIQVVMRDSDTYLQNRVSHLNHFKPATVAGKFIRLFQDLKNPSK
jgi:glycogen synthase